MAGFWDRRKLTLLLSIFSKLKYGRLTVTLPDGEVRKFSGTKDGPHASLKINTHDAVSRMLRDGKMGFCEAVMDGALESSSMAELIELAVLQGSDLDARMEASLMRRVGLKLYHQLRSNTRSGSARNIAHHYDLGNEFYESWLDGTMTYSSALYEAESDDLSTAQTNKYRRLADLADIQPGDHVLEIGCGWGGFAKFAIEERDARVTGITISKAQHEFATRRLAEAGLSDRADVRLVDYRDVEGTFDRIVSIEMFEAVGQAYWQTYFESVSRLLKRGGRAALQAITIEEHAFEEYRQNPDFIQRYIFPGGMLPSPERLDREFASADLSLLAREDFAHDYARTLEEWRHRFLDVWPEVKALGFDECFRNMWEYYLAYCEAGFSTGSIDVSHFTVTRD